MTVLVAQSTVQVRLSVVIRKKDGRVIDKGVISEGVTTLPGAILERLFPDKKGQEEK